MDVEFDDGSGGIDLLHVKSAVKHLRYQKELS